MKTNVIEKLTTHGGATASKVKNEEALRRAVMACMLWEDEFYESGVSIAERINALVKNIDTKTCGEIAIEARTKMNIRHAPLLICAAMAANKKLTKEILSQIIQRADELSEFLAIYWKDGKKPLANQIKKGLAIAITKFNEYELAKYNRDSKVKLRDVLFLCHAKPLDGVKGYTKKARKDGVKLPEGKGHELFQKLVDDKLTIPDTWETNLSAGKDKKETWERLVAEKKLGSLAFLRNLRNMSNAKVSDNLIDQGIENINFGNVLPFRFIAAAQHVPQYEDKIEKMLFKGTKNRPKLSGKTIFIVDVSGSMGGRLSSKSEMDRLDAAIGLAIIMRELCEDVKIYATAGDDHQRIHATSIVPARRGFALADAIKKLTNNLGGGGIFLKQCMDYVYEKEQNADRVIIFTDEQDCDNKLSPNTSKLFGTRNYIMNVASSDRGIAYDKTTHISGWSDAVIDYIIAYEKN
ncbi:MAG: TROVE domain-containing protein [Nitrosarchaeum sp.]|nr:TROVE domain-containing protein [Nitrosarchaeum sp.]